MWVEWEYILCVSNCLLLLQSLRNWFEDCYIPLWVEFVRNKYHPSYYPKRENLLMFTYICIYISYCFCRCLISFPVHGGDHICGSSVVRLHIVCYLSIAEWCDVIYCGLSDVSSHIIYIILLYPKHMQFSVWLFSFYLHTWTGFTNHPCLWMSVAAVVDVGRSTVFWMLVACNLVFFWSHLWKMLVFKLYNFCWFCLPLRAVQGKSICLLFVLGSCGCGMCSWSSYCLYESLEPV